MYGDCALVVLQMGTSVVFPQLLTTWNQDPYHASQIVGEVHFRKIEWRKPFIILLFRNVMVYIP